MTALWRQRQLAALAATPEADVMNSPLVPAEAPSASSKPVAATAEGKEAPREAKESKDAPEAYPDEGSDGSGGDLYEELSAPKHTLSAFATKPAVSSFAPKLSEAGDEALGFAFPTRASPKAAEGGLLFSDADLFGRVSPPTGAVSALSAPSHPWGVPAPAAPIVPTEEAIDTLLALGDGAYPRVWCELGLRKNRGDVGAALNWILDNSDALQVAGDDFSAFEDKPRFGSGGFGFPVPGDAVPAPYTFGRLAERAPEPVTSPFGAPVFTPTESARAEPARATKAKPAKAKKEREEKEPSPKASAEPVPKPAKLERASSSDGKGAGPAADAPAPAPLLPTDQFEDSSDDEKSATPLVAAAEVRGATRVRTCRSALVREAAVVLCCMCVCVSCAVSCDRVCVCVCVAAPGRGGGQHGGGGGRQPLLAQPALLRQEGRLVWLLTLGNIGQRFRARRRRVPHAGVGARTQPQRRGEALGGHKR